MVFFLSINTGQRKILLVNLGVIFGIFLVLLLPFFGGTEPGRGDHGETCHIKHNITPTSSLL